MNHPITVWYLAQARMDDLHRDLARPRLPRTERRGLVERVRAHLPRRRQHPSPQVAAAVGAGLPMGCCA